MGLLGYIFTLILNLSTLLSLATGENDTSAICKNRNAAGRISKWPDAGQDFKDLVTNNEVFVDKSLLIKDFIEHPAKVILVTSPHDWGKTINLQMMHSFFQPELKSQGQRQTTKETWNYKLFARGRLDDGKVTKMNIAQYPDIIKKYLGQNPVIYLNLGNVLDCKSKSIVEVLKRPIRDAYTNLYKKIDFFRRWNKVWMAKQAEKHLLDIDFKFLCKFKLNDGNFTQDEALISLKFLSAQLYKNFGKKVLIFVDNFDGPLKDIYSGNEHKNPLDKSIAEGWVNFLRDFFKTTFWENDYLEKVFITGEMNFEVSKIFPTGDPTFTHYNVIRNDFYKYFGLTDNEVTLLLDEYGIKGKLAEDARKWYGGYAVTNDVKAYLYNIQSVRKFLKSRTINMLEHTRHGVSFEKLLREEKMKPIVDCLMNRTSYAVELDDLSFRVDDYEALGEVLGGKKGLAGSGVDVFLRLLVSEGYLTIGNVGEATSKGVGVKVPNEQVVATLIVMMREWIANNRNVSGGH